MTPNRDASKSSSAKSSAIRTSQRDRRPAKLPGPLSGRRKRISAIVRTLQRTYPNASVALSHQTPLELLIATILSAQCTDERVNIVTRSLFKKYRTAKEYADAHQHELEQDIKSTGFYRSKARNIIRCCTMLIERYGGNVPGTMEELVQLAGVGRKTANVVLANVFGKAEGIVVDTHVRRLSQRLGFTRESNPEKIEQDLMEILPQKKWMSISNLLILHGRATCRARSPQCPVCSIQSLCPSASKFS